MRERYKFENFREQSFPVYSSQQRGSGVLAVPHFHQAAELDVVTAGSVVFCINADRYVCKQGDVVFIPPYGVHSAVCQEGESEITGLTFELSLIQEGAFGISAEKILNKSAITEFVFPVGTYDALKRSLFRAVAVYTQNTQTYKLEMLSCLYEISALLIKNYFGSYKAYKEYDRMQLVVDYISCNYFREISLSELSGLLNVCNDHFIRLFKSATNKTPAVFIRDIRLQEAMKLLLKSDRSMTEIAAAVGFSSGNYMTRAFRSALHMTPGQYRKSNRKA